MVFIGSFQSTHPSGVRPGLVRSSSPTCNFNPRTPVGCDRVHRRWFARCRYFNPRTPVGCDPMVSLPLPEMSIFQSTHPSGVRLARHSPPQPYMVRFQSTHPSGVRRDLRRIELLRFEISIHAPQWGATLFGKAKRLVQSISIHAPQWGATGVIAPQGIPLVISIHAPQWGATRSSGSSWSGKPFQSTHPSGVRPLHATASRRLRFISIHAPQWGATRDTL